MDIKQRRGEMTTHRERVLSAHDDVRPFMVTALTPYRLLAENLQALLVLEKLSDLHAFWLLLEQELGEA